MLSVLEDKIRIRARPCNILYIRKKLFISSPSHVRKISFSYLASYLFSFFLVPSRREQSRRFLPEADQLWKAGATTLQGHSTQDFVPAEPIQVDPSKKVVLMLRLVARYIHNIHTQIKCHELWNNCGLL